MKRQNFQYNYEYYNHLSRSRFSSRTSRRLKSENGDSITNRSKTRFYNRIEKACTTFSNNDLNKEINLCKRQIERLEKEILKKDKIIFEMKEINMQNKEIESELIEVYRVLYMYEGKIGEYEKEMKKLEVAIASKMPQDMSYKVEELLESYRLENGDLGAQIEQKNRIIMELDSKLKKIENKYFNTAWKLSSAQREISNPLKKRFPHLRNTITMNQAPLLQKEKAMKFREQNKSPTTTLRNQYDIGFETSPRDRQSVKFKKVEASPLQQSTPTKAYGGQSDTKHAISPNSISYGNNLAKYNQYDNYGNKLTSTEHADYQFGSYTKAEAPLEKLNTLTTSNPNISSQVTISSGVVRRIQGGRVYRQQSPSRNAGINYNTPKVVTRLDMLGQTVNQVQNMMKSSNQPRYGSPPIRASVNPQSIYLN